MIQPDTLDTVMRYGGYTLHFIDICNKSWASYLKYRKIKELNNEGNQATWAHYVDCTISTLSTLLTAGSFVHTVKTNQLHDQKIEKRKEVEQLEKIAHFKQKDLKDTISDATETLNNTLPEDAFLKNISIKELVDDRLRQLGSSPTNQPEENPNPQLAADLANKYTSATEAWANFSTALFQYRGIETSLRDAHHLQAKIDVANCVCNFASEIAQQERPFTRTATNRAIINSALSAYIDLYPESKVSQFIEEHISKDPRTRSLVISGFAWATGAFVSRIAAFFQPTHMQPPREQNDLPNYIPEIVEDDEVLRRRVCALSQAPIRFPMVLTQDGHDYLFETSWILSWCTECERQRQPFTNPLTNLPFDINTLRPDEEGLLEIENRLEAIRGRWDVGFFEIDPPDYIVQGLQSAAIHGNINVARSFIENHTIDLQANAARNLHQYSLLHYVALHCLHPQKAIEMMQMLIEKEPTLVSLASEDGKTPLHLAVDQQLDLDLCRRKIALLLQNHAEINARDNEGNTALHSAFRQQNPRIEVIQTLVQADASWNTRNNAGKTPLQLAQEVNPDWVRNNYEKLLDL